MDTRLSQAWDILQNAKRELREVLGPDFSIDISIDAYGVDHPLAIEARELDYKPGRQDDTAWLERSDEYVNLSVFVE